MADVNPLKLQPTGGGQAELREFAVGDTVPKTALPELTPADVGADPAGAADAAVAAHVAMPDPHSQYADAEDLLDARFQSTGLISGGQITINAGDNTKMDIAAGIAVFADYTDPEKSTATVLPFGPVVAATVPNLAAANVSYIGLNAAGEIVQQTTRFTNDQRRSIVSLGLVVHSNRANLSGVNTLVSPNRQLLSQFGDGLRALGQLNLSGNTFSSVGANLQIQKSAGELFSPGANFHVNPDDPHSAVLGAASPATFRYRLANGTEYADRTTVDPAQYDNAGVLTAVPANRYTVQLISVFQSGVVRMQYGQALYNQLSDAVAAAQAQSMLVESNIAENGVIRGYLAVKGDATALNNTSQAVFITLSKFGASAAVSPLSISTTDQLTEGATNLYFTNARVRTTLLTGLSVLTNAVVTAADTVLDAFGKLQAQITSHFGVGGSTHPAATTSVAGFMSSTDKTKLNGVAEGANNYTHPNHSGDVTSVGDGVQTIAAGVVSNAKLANMATQTIKGRDTAGTGAPEDLTAAQVRAVIAFEANARAQTEAMLVAGDNVTLTPAGTGATRTLTIAADGSGAGEPVITPGTTTQYWRGDKTWQDLPAAVRAAVLTDLSTASSADVAATDTVLAAIGKLQAGKVPRDSATGAAQLPAGTTAQRPAGALGYTRINSTTGDLEYHNGTAWGNAGGTDFTIIYPNGGSAGSPANVAPNSRYVDPNPFPGFRVLCLPEIFVGGAWSESRFTGLSISTSTGVSSGQEADDTIVTLTGINSLLQVTQVSFFTGATRSTITVPAPCRVKVWKVKGAVA